jgi:hypothetical protein
MDRAAAERELKTVEAALAQDRDHIQRLLTLLAELDHNDHQATAAQAREALKTAMQNQDFFRRRRDELQRTLADD